MPGAGHSPAPKRRAQRVYREREKMKIMALGPTTSWQIGGETMETVKDFIFLGSKITTMMIAAMKLKDIYSLEGKL